MTARRADDTAAADDAAAAAAPLAAAANSRDGSSSQQQQGPQPAAAAGPNPGLNPGLNPGPNPGAGTTTPTATVPPPWRVRGDVYCISFWTSQAAARAVPDSHAYSPLEAAAPGYAHPPGSSRVGGLGMVQMIRYYDSPVGPYDELLVVPGYYDWTRDDGRPVRRRNPRISRIYVSQRDACYNGRINWNAPKHLARFDWTTATDGGGGVSVKVYPHDTTGDAAEATPSPEPFFQASFRPVRYTPAFPFATQWVARLGFNPTLVLPPLPAGRGSQGELPGTDRWCALVPNQYSRRTRLGWFDLAQRRDADADHDNFWPGLGRWHLGFKMEDAEVVFDVPVDTWPAAKSKSNL